MESEKEKKMLAIKEIKGKREREYRWWGTLLVQHLKGRPGFFTLV